MKTYQGLFYLATLFDWVQQPQREAMHGCGSIPRNRAGKFTFPNVTMVDGVVQLLLKIPYKLYN